MAAGKKYWFAKLPSRTDGTKTSLDNDTAVGAFGFLSNAVQWWDFGLARARAGVSTISALLSSDREYSDQNLAAWQRDAFRVNDSDIDYTLSGYPRSFWYKVRTRVSTNGNDNLDGALGGEGNPLRTTNLISPFKNLGLDIYINHIIIKTIDSTVGAGKYEVGITAGGSLGSFTSTLTTSGHGFVTDGGAGHIQIVRPELTNNVGTLGGVWKFDETLGLNPDTEANCEGWSGELHIECYCPELYSYGLDQNQYMKSFL